MPAHLSPIPTGQTRERQVCNGSARAVHLPAASPDWSLAGLPVSVPLTLFSVLRQVVSLSPSILRPYDRSVLRSRPPFSLARRGGRISRHIAAIRNLVAIGTIADIDQTAPIRLYCWLRAQTETVTYDAGRSGFMTFRCLMRSGAHRQFVKPLVCRGGVGRIAIRRPGIDGRRLAYTQSERGNVGKTSYSRDSRSYTRPQRVACSYLSRSRELEAVRHDPSVPT
jgi:hypothetical protein